MRSPCLLALSTLIGPLAALAGAQDPAALPPDAQRPAGPDLEVPPGWVVRVDGSPEGVVVGSDQESSDVWFVTMTPGWHVTTGPAAIFYHPASTATGDFAVEAGFHLFDPGDRLDAFGVFLGGSALDGEEGEWTGFLLRNSGEYAVVRRRGDAEEMLHDWTPHPAVVRHRNPAVPSVVNDLEVLVAGDGVELSINGEPALTLPRSAVPTEGIVGLRIGPRLNLHVSKLIVRP